MSAPLITADELRRLLSYDTSNGEFRWLVTRTSERVGAIAGRIANTGYRIIRINRRDYLAHRLAWFYVYGRWPNDQIDHIDNDKLNNSINNLREATNAQNKRNRGPHKNNKCGLKGVLWEPRRCYWIAQIKIDGKQKYLGKFPTPEQAHHAYVAASQRLHGEFANAG